MTFWSDLVGSGVNLSGLIILCTLCWNSIGKFQFSPWKYSVVSIEDFDIITPSVFFLFFFFLGNYFLGVHIIIYIHIYAPLMLQEEARMIFLSILSELISGIWEDSTRILAGQTRMVCEIHSFICNRWFAAMAKSLSMTDAKQIWASTKTRFFVFLPLCFYFFRFFFPFVCFSPWILFFFSVGRKNIYLWD